MTSFLNDRLAAIRAPFEAFGGVWTEAALLQPLGLILDLAGEAVRSRLLVVSGAGEETALRPDFTIPITRAHIASGAAEGRYLYEGRVFRAASPDDSEGAETLQIGAEAFGVHEDPALEDAAVAALAWAAARAGGRKDLRLVLGDVGLFGAFLSAIGVPEGLRSRLLAVFANPPLLAAEVARAELRTSGDAADGRLYGLLADLSEGEAAKVLEELWALAGIQPVGGRSAAEIAHRIALKAGLRSEGPLGSREAGLIRRYLEIADVPRPALRRAEALAAEAGGDLSAPVAAWSRRLTALAKAGAPETALVFAAAFARPFSYYDGFVFEVRSTALGPEAPIATGGRYDALPGRLGGRPGAVGCMVRPARAVLEAAS